MSTKTSKSSTRKVRAADLEALLFDKNDCIASLAMEQLTENSECARLISTKQDSADPLVRRRIHQLSSIVNQRKLLNQMVQDNDNGDLEAWGFLQMIDRLYDARASRKFLQDISRDFFAAFIPQGRPNLQQVADFMTNEGFVSPRPPWTNVCLYLIGDVLENQQGAPILLCILARQLALMHGLPLSVCIYCGRFTLIDAERYVADPMLGWEIMGPVDSAQYHICTNQELIRVYSSMLIGNAVANWECYDVHKFTKIHQAMERFKGNPYPYPFGDFEAPEETDLDS